MKKYKNTIFYLGVLGGFSALIYWIIGSGKQLEKGENIVHAASAGSSWSDFLVSMTHNIKDPLAVLLAQIIMIILVARLFGWFFKKIGQPLVIGEIIAGIALGPSLLGLYFPEFYHLLFPENSLENLKFLSQIGLILFMFVIGMELDVKVLKNRANEAVVISHASIVIPFALGIGLAYFVYNQFAPAGVKFLSFCLFMGIAMSITAFPVLARIVQERGMHKTKLGAIAITCAAADDITAWCLLAVVIAIVKAGTFESSLYVISLAGIYVAAMIFLVRPFLKRIGELYDSKESLSKPVVAIFFLLLIISSYATELIGIHALFGAFMMGAIMPETAKFRTVFISKVEDVSVILLLPLFFVFTGLKTELGLLNEPYLWKITGLIILVAVVGKFFGSAIAAKFVGQSWRNSLVLGALMNTRGLMELIVLNIGLALGVLTTEVFTMMVIMALVTTFMTGPALDIINYIFKTTDISEHEEEDIHSKYRVLLSFGNNEKGKSLLRLASSLIRKQKDSATLTALHLSMSDEMHTYNMEDKEKTIFSPIMKEAVVLKQEITTIFKATIDIDAEIIDIANQGEYDLLLVGLGKSIFEGTLLGKVIGFTSRMINPERLLDKFTGKEGLFDNSPFDERTRQIVMKIKIPLGILIDKDLKEVNKVFIPIYGSEDSFLIDYAQKLIYNNNAQLSFLAVNSHVQSNFVIASALDSLKTKYPKNVVLENETVLRDNFLAQNDLIIVSLESWKELLESRPTWLSAVPSLLIIKP